MKKVLVTGSLGYLGSVLTQNLVENGYECVGYDTGFFKDSLLYPAPQTPTKLCDVREIVESDLENTDAVVHFAGISNDPVGKLSPDLIYDPTRAYAFKIAKMCKARGIKFIFASSCSIYGIGSDDFLTEESQVFPQTHYSKNKLQVEEDLASISDHSFSPVALRFATVFGSSPRIRFDVVVNMLTGMAFTDERIVLNSDGKSWRPNLHILDVCQSIRLAIEHKSSDGKLLVLNVGSAENNLQIIDIAKIIQKNMGSCEIKFLSENPEIDKEGLIRDRKVQEGGKDTRTYKVSFEKINKIFPNFKCQWTVEQGVQEMLETFKKVGLNKNSFKSRGFYRLQQLEHLHGNGYLSDDLYWRKARELV